MGVTNPSLFDGVADWILRTASIKSAVLFGSSAAVSKHGDTSHDPWADIDLHVIVPDASTIEGAAWNVELPEHGFCFHASRTATGRVRKVTVVFASGQIDFVIVPTGLMRIAALALRWRLYTKVRIIGDALNEMATCLHGGYQFLKGQDAWMNLYQHVCLLPGVRLADHEIRNLANASICDVFWLFQKVKAGELIAAQHVLHSRVSETNLRLWRELRLRQNIPLQSFGLGRRLERNVSQAERDLFSVSARLVPTELYVAAWRALDCLASLMANLEPNWSIPPSMAHRLRQYRVSSFDDDARHLSL
jgi:hypothetical protein